MNLIARPNFAPPRRSLLTAGMTIGTTLALHNAAEAEAMCDRVWIFEARTLSTQPVRRGCGTRGGTTVVSAVISGETDPCHRTWDKDRACYAGIGTARPAAGEYPASDAAYPRAQALKSSPGHLNAPAGIYSKKHPQKVHKNGVVMQLSRGPPTPTPGARRAHRLQHRQVSAQRRAPSVHQ
jgi:hypothetical protein